MTSFALIVGTVIVRSCRSCRCPRAWWCRPPVFVGAVALSAAAIYCLTLACGWYPSRLATRMPPADALRYE